MSTYKSRLSNNILESFNESDLLSEGSPFFPVEKEIIIPNTLNKTFRIEKGYEITIPDGITRIGQRAFCGANRYLLIINIPQSVTSIGDEAFYESSLHQINLPDSIKNIGASAFYSCQQLRSIKLPNQLTTISRCLFNNCYNLSNVEIGDNIKEINAQAFYHCPKITSIKLPDGIEKISHSAFEQCSALRKINLPDSLTELGSAVFCGCSNLQSITIPPKIKIIPNNAFGHCSRLEDISIPNSVEEIHDCAFYSDEGNYRLDCLTIPDSVHKIMGWAFCGIKKINILGKDITDKDIINNLGDVYYFLKFACANKKFLPHVGVMSNTPNIDIGKFYAHQKDWKEILNTFLQHNNIKPEEIKSTTSQSKIFIDNDINYNNYSQFQFNLSPLITEINNIVNNNELNNAITDLYCISYALGLLEKGSTSERAKAFIKENICTLTPSKIHNLYGGLQIKKHEFVSEFADFYITNFHKPRIIQGNILRETEVHFLEKYHSEADTETITNYTSHVYNQWQTKIKEALPNRGVLSSREHASERNSYTEEAVINALITTKYKNVNRGNEAMAELVGKYGYSQIQFETLQDWYEKAKAIPEEDIILSATPDDNHDITYELLDKSDPYALILGEVTNCCQTVNQPGRPCLEYGLTQPNSGFVKFIYEDKTIAQSWVWYNPDTRTVCLDNIEVPTIWQKKMKNKVFELRFKDCISRLSQGLIEDMTQNGYPVDRVTVGDKHNDLRNIMQNFKITEDSDILSTPKDYGAAYSDARELQYVIAVNNRINTINNNTTAIINTAHEIND